MYPKRVFVLDEAPAFGIAGIFSAAICACNASSASALSSALITT